MTRKHYKKTFGLFVLLFGTAFFLNAGSAQASDNQTVPEENRFIKPLIMVMIQSVETDISYIPIMLEGSRSLENFIENELSRSGFELIDASQFSSIKKAEIAMSKRDASLIALSAKDFGAEVLVYGEVRREFVNIREIHGTLYRFFSNELNLKAVKTTSGEIIYSGMRTKNPSALENMELLQDAATELVTKMVPALSKIYSERIKTKKTIEVKILNITFSQISTIKTAIGNIKGVSSVKTRSFQDNVAVLNVDFQSGVEQLSMKIDSIRVPDMEILRMEANTIHVKTQKEPPPLP